MPSALRRRWQPRGYPAKALQGSRVTELEACHPLIGKLAAWPTLGFHAHHGSNGWSTSLRRLAVKAFPDRIGPSLFWQCLRNSLIFRLRMCP